MSTGLQLMPWARVYLQIMARMPGGDRCRSEVARFVMTNGLVWVEG